MNLNIKDEAVVGMMLSRMEHLHACQDFVTTFRNGGWDRKIVARQAKSKWKHEHGRFERTLYDQDLRMQELNKFLAENKSPTRALVKEMEVLAYFETIVLDIFVESRETELSDRIQTMLEDLMRNIKE